MNQSAEQFAQMLTEAVYHIRLLESKSLQIVQDEIGYVLGRKGGRTIEYWRQGNVPGKRTDLEKLTYELVRRGNFGSQWAEQFIEAGGSPYTAALRNYLFPDQGANKVLPAGDRQRVRKFYRHLIGREEWQKQAMRALADTDGCWVVGIDGLGGIGKTALAQDLAEQCERQQRFQHTVWLSAATHHQIESRKEAQPLTIETILNDIGAQLGLPEVVKLPRQEKTRRLQGLMRTRPVLVILDNLETAVEPQEEIIRYLQPFLNPSKLLLTSRRRFSGEVYALHLEGLDIAQAITFIQHDAAEKGIEHLQQAETKALKSIAITTGGSPLALKLVVSQLAYLPLDVVLQNLQSVSPLNHLDDEGEYVYFYKSVFFHSWALLNQESKKLLVAMANFVPGDGSHFRAIQQISDLPQADFINSIDVLWKLSLLEIGEVPNLHQMRYFLHPLTQYFVLSDIAKVI